MGNQSGKLIVKGSKFIDDVDLKNSRTNWIAGTKYLLILREKWGAKRPKSN